MQYLLGDKRREVQRVGKGLGMRAQTLQAYLDLMEEHGDRVERQRERSKMKQKKKSKM